MVTPDGDEVPMILTVGNHDAGSTSMSGAFIDPQEPPL